MYIDMFRRVTFPLNSCKTKTNLEGELATGGGGQIYKIFFFFQKHACNKYKACIAQINQIETQQNVFVTKFIHISDSNSFIQHAIKTSVN